MEKEKITSSWVEEFLKRVTTPNKNRRIHEVITDEEIDLSKANPEFLAEIERLKAQRNIEEEK